MRSLAGCTSTFHLVLVSCCCYQAKRGTTAIGRGLPTVCPARPAITLTSRDLILPLEGFAIVGLSARVQSSVKPAPRGSINRSRESHSVSPAPQVCPRALYYRCSQSRGSVPSFVGFFNPSPGQPECFPCPAGRFSAEYGASVCSACPRGSYQAVTGQHQCLPWYAVAC